MEYISYQSKLLFSLLVILLIAFHSCDEPKRAQLSNDMNDTILRNDHDELEVEIYTKEQLEYIRNYLPQDVELDNDNIIEKLQEAYADTSTVRGRILTGKLSDKSLTQREIRNLLLQELGKEAYKLDQRLLIDGEQFKNGSINYEGLLDSITETSIHIMGIKGNSIELDFSYSPGIVLSYFTPHQKVYGKFKQNQTPTGIESSNILSDQIGIIYAAESIGNTSNFNDSELRGIRVKQITDDIGDTKFINECYEVYFPKVSVAINETSEPLIVESGKQVLITTNEITYLIKIIKSKYIKRLSCKSSFEESPWQLDYSINRLDDKLLIKKLKEDKEDTNQKFTRDDIRPIMRKTQDNPPNKKIKGDN